MLRRIFFAGFSVLMLCAGTASAQTSTTVPILEYVYPAPGCPDQMPSYQSTSRYCKTLSVDTCKASPVCIQGDNRCYPKLGVTVSTPSMDPAKPIFGSTFPATVALAHAIGADQLAEEGYTAAAAKRYDMAINFYTQAMKKSLDAVETDFLVKRGLIYELKGDKQKALHDYCTGVAAATDWQSEQIAFARITQITNPSAERLPIPQFGRSGVLQITKSSQALAPLKIKTPKGWDYLLKLINVKTNKTDMIVFVRSNSEFETKAPLGTYRVVGVQGPVWYGKPHYFGDKSIFFKLKNKDGEEQSNFYKEGRMLHGKAWTFIKQVDGNLLNPTITKEEFERDE